MNAELRADIEALEDTVRRFALERIVPHVDNGERLAMSAMALGFSETCLDEDQQELESDADCVAQVCMLKNHATQTMQFCADQAVQVLGGMGFMRGTKCERICREVKVIMIGGGAEEIMEDLAARQLGL